ncbi:uncharacterized protein VICG_00300 [Vittaforma corneae ATCC 50505]|uniref:H/ACA ribonucleoprotein complex subunit n=1 Tax=Vittaforma corneae (strain ATCC 50505) TaxID=993615 RepID=L2GNT6_VITCO|nr:uncharacterized protein VICG_00300 [Vittaforma corneae ATCC 50505]ELA42548.1 hypothetical protein VICG_00300 [Vittaforma corneae ATCC 50505]
MAKFANQKRHSVQKSFTTESVHLGTLVHPAGDLLVLKLGHRDIPYPNAPVLFEKQQIGKIDEVFGPVDDVYVSVKLDPSRKAADFTANSKFEAYKDKFIFKDRFLPREEVEKNKESNDKKRAVKDKNGANSKKKLNFPKQKGKFDNRSFGRNKSDKKFHKSSRKFV